MKENLELYNRFREVPNDAKKEITGGRLNGKTDINPMWRIKCLTEAFGPCGIGWYYEVTNQWLETGNNGEIAGFCNINLYIKDGNEWSKPIFGTGGSAFIAKESKGLYTSDEVFKMALTDAISVACKALGFGANVYWDSDKTKYDRPVEESTRTEKAEPAPVKKAEPKKEEEESFEPTPVIPPTENEVSVMIMDILSSKNLKEITAKWNMYKKFDEACGMKITGAVRKVRGELGV